jgi:AraC family transcriptional regulator
MRAIEIHSGQKLAVKERTAVQQPEPIAIGTRKGVRAHVSNYRACVGVARAQLTLQWETEPGWVQLSFGAPALCAVANEIGGRCESRAVADQLADGEYFGSEHLSFVSVGRSITVYATEMRQLQFVCYLLYPEVVDCLTPIEKAAIYRAPSRYMFKNERLAICAGLLNDCGREAAAAADRYAAAISRALLIALMEVVLDRRKHSVKIGLSNAPLAKVCAYIRDNLDHNISVRELQRIAQMPASKFARAFRDATGLSPQRWLMDARVRSAQRLMMDAPCGSLMEIAELTGFSDQSHFSRVFQEIVGVRPAVWLHRFK